MELNNREIALLIWAGIAMALMLLKGDIRSSLGGLVKAFIAPQVISGILIFLAYIVGVVALAASLGAWEPELLSDTILWLLATGAVLFGSFQETHKPDFFERNVRRAIGVAVFVEVLISLYVFPLPVELIFLPSMVFLAGMLAVAEAKEEHAQAKSCLEGLMGVIGTSLLLFVLINLIVDLKDLDPGDVARDFALPVWLTLAAIPFVYVLGLYAAYEGAYRMIGFYADDKPSARRAQRSLWRLGVRARRVGAFTRRWQQDIARADDPRQVIGEFKAEARV